MVWFFILSDINFIEEWILFILSFDYCLNSKNQSKLPNLIFFFFRRALNWKNEKKTLLNWEQSTWNSSKFTAFVSLLSFFTYHITNDPTAMLFIIDFNFNSFLSIKSYKIIKIKKKENVTTNTISIETEMWTQRCRFHTFS